MTSPEDIAPVLESYYEAFPKAAEYLCKLKRHEVLPPAALAGIAPGSFAVRYSAPASSFASSFAPALSSYEGARDDMSHAIEIAFRMFKKRPPLPLFTEEAPEVGFRRRMRGLRGKVTWDKSPTIPPIVWDSVTHEGE